MRNTDDFRATDWITIIMFFVRFLFHHVLNSDLVASARRFSAFSKMKSHTETIEVWNFRIFFVVVSRIAWRRSLCRCTGRIWWEEDSLWRRWSHCGSETWCSCGWLGEGLRPGRWCPRGTACTCCCGCAGGVGLYAVPAHHNSIRGWKDTTGKPFWSLLWTCRSTGDNLHAAWGS